MNANIYRFNTYNYFSAGSPSNLSRMAGRAPHTILQKSNTQAQVQLSRSLSAHRLTTSRRTLNLFIEGRLFFTSPATTATASSATSSTVATSSKAIVLVPASAAAGKKFKTLRRRRRRRRRGHCLLWGEWEDESSRAPPHQTQPPSPPPFFTALSSLLPVAESSYPAHTYCNTTGSNSHSRREGPSPSPFAGQTGGGERQEEAWGGEEKR